MKQYIVSEIQDILKKKDFKSEAMGTIKTKINLLKSSSDTMAFKFLSKGLVFTEPILKTETKSDFLETISLIFDIDDDKKGMLKSDFKNVDITENNIILVKTLILFLDTFQYNQDILNIKDIRCNTDLIIKCMEYIDLKQSDIEIIKFIKKYFESFEENIKINSWLECILYMLNKRIEEE